MTISKRLKEIVALVPFDARFIADIGADHGYVSDELLKTRKDIRIYACDNKKNPFMLLKSRLAPYKNAFVALKDGLNDLPLEVDTIIIAGMGGETIVSILKEGEKYLKQIKYLIVSPHNDIYNVRKIVNTYDFKLKEELFIFDNMKYYDLSLYERGFEELSEKELKFGQINLKRKDSVFMEYIDKEIKNRVDILQKHNLSQERIMEIYKEIEELKSI